MAWGHITPGPGCDLLPSPSPSRPGPAALAAGPRSEPGAAAAGRGLGQCPRPWASIPRGQPGPRDSRDPGSDPPEHPRIPHIPARSTQRCQGGSLEVFEKVAKENISRTLTDNQRCLKRAKELSTLFFGCDLSEENEYERNPVIVLTPFSHLFSSHPKSHSHLYLADASHYPTLPANAK